MRDREEEGPRFSSSNKQPTTPGGRIFLTTSRRSSQKRWEGGGGGGANLMYNIPSFSKEPAVAQTRNATEAVRAYRVWRRVGVPNGGTKQKSRAGGRLAASNRPPAREDGGTHLSRQLLFTAGWQQRRWVLYARYRPLGCVCVCVCANQQVRPSWPRQL